MDESNRVPPFPSAPTPISLASEDVGPLPGHDRPWAVGVTLKDTLVLARPEQERLPGVVDMGILIFGRGVLVDLGGGRYAWELVADLRPVGERSTTGIYEDGRLTVDDPPKHLVAGLKTDGDIVRRRRRYVQSFSTDYPKHRFLIRVPAVVAGWITVHEERISWVSIQNKLAHDSCEALCAHFGHAQFGKDAVAAVMELLRKDGGGRESPVESDAYW